MGTGLQQQALNIHGVCRENIVGPRLTPCGDSVRVWWRWWEEDKEKRKMSRMKLMDSMWLKPDTLTEWRRASTALSVMKSSLVGHQYGAAGPK